jgi:hypothetical protein
VQHSDHPACQSRRSAFSLNVVAFFKWKSRQDPMLCAFRNRLAELGFVEGRNVRGLTQ